MNQTSRWTWDELDMELSVLDALVFAERRPLSDPPQLTGPGVYLVFCTGVDLYTPVTGGDGTYPVYVGSSTASVRERIGRHRCNTAPIPSLGHGRRLHVAAVELPSAGSSLLLEAALLARLQPVWNACWCAGYGSRQQGRTRRKQAPPPHSLLHPGRQVGVGTTSVSTRILRQRVRAHLERTWVPLWPPLLP